MAAEPPLDPSVRAKLAVLAEARHRWDHVYAVVEETAARRSEGLPKRRATASDDPVRKLMAGLARATNDVTQLLVEHGFVTTAEEVREITLLARRREGVGRSALRRMREVVAAVYTSLDTAEQRLRASEPDSPS